MKAVPDELWSYVLCHLKYNLLNTFFVFFLYVYLIIYVM